MRNPKQGHTEILQYYGAKSLEKGAVGFFMNGSKLGRRIGGEVCFRELTINSMFRLPDHCSVFQAEVAAIKVAVDYCFEE